MRSLLRMAASRREVGGMPPCYWTQIAIVQACHHYAEFIHSVFSMLTHAPSSILLRSCACSFYPSLPCRVMPTPGAPLTADELSYYDINAPLFGFMGAAFALIFSNLGAAYGTGKSGMGISALGVGKPELVMKSIVPVVMAGVLGIYGLIIAVIIANAVSGVDGGRPAYGQFSAMAHFGGGLACGLSGLAAGMAIGVVGDSLTRASAEQPKLFVGMVLILIFAEALGLYGLIVGLILASKA